jgi:uncharacterized protein YjiS (DUF1127 family)
MNILLSPLSDAQSRLRSSFKALAVIWSAVKEDWRDQRRERFEREHLAPLIPSLTRLSTSLDELRDLVAKSERELADDFADSRE